MRILFQGLKGAFSESVAMRLRNALFTHSDAKHDAEQISFSASQNAICPLQSVDSFAALAKGCLQGATLGALPVFNTLGGPVEPALAALATYQPPVFGEHQLLAKHHLWARTEMALSEIHHIASHPQALAQCQKLIQKYNFKTIETTNTAVAAARLAQDAECGFSASLSSERAGTLYGLHRLLANVQDSDDNTTTFLLLGSLPMSLQKHAENKLFSKNICVDLTESSLLPPRQYWIKGQKYALQKNSSALSELSRIYTLNTLNWIVL